MPAIEEALRGVEFGSGFDPSVLRLGEYGFLEVPEKDLAAQGLVRLVGFGAAPSSWPDSERYQQGDTIVPVVDLADLKSQDRIGLRRVDSLGKGVGPRMYKTPQAAHGFADLPETFGAYTFDVDPRRVLDVRETEGGKLPRIARHAFRLAYGMVSPERMVDRVHRSYGDAQAVLFTQPPNAERRQTARRGVTNPQGMPGEFFIIRDPDMRPHRIGSAHRLDTNRAV